MRDLTLSLQNLNRPHLLVRAARIALGGFQRDAALTRIFGYVPTGRAHAIIGDLIEREELMNSQRKTGDVTYNIARHILILTALISEANGFLNPQDALT